MLSNPNTINFKILSGMANSVDPDQTAPLQEQSDLGLHCLHMPICQQLWCTNFRTFTTSCIIIPRWRGDYLDKKQYWFPANFVAEIEPQEDSAEAAPLGSLQKGAIDVQGCIIGM